MFPGPWGFKKCTSNKLESKALHPGPEKNEDLQKLWFPLVPPFCAAPFENRQNTFEKIPGAKGSAQRHRSRPCKTSGCHGCSKETIGLDLPRPEAQKMKILLRNRKKGMGYRTSTQKPQEMNIPLEKVQTHTQCRPRRPGGRGPQSQQGNELEALLWSPAKGEGGLVRA